MGSNGLFFLRILLLPTLVLVGAMLLAAPPELRPPIRSAVSVEAAPTHQFETVVISPERAALQSILGDWREPEILELQATEPEVVPRALSALNVRIGPGESYVIIGQLPRGGRLDIVGRDQTGVWLAVNFTPDSKLNGWIQASKVSGLESASSLPVAPITLLPR